MSAREFEAFLARIYADPAALARFRTNPRGEAQKAGLTDEECFALEKTDWVGLEMAASSFARKRQLKALTRSKKLSENFLHKLFIALPARFRWHL
jgi:hypothetical protein